VGLGWAGHSPPRARPQRRAAPSVSWRPSGPQHTTTHTAPAAPGANTTDTLAGGTDRPARSRRAAAAPPASVPRRVAGSAARRNTVAAGAALPGPPLSLSLALLPRASPLGAPVWPAPGPSGKADACLLSAPVQRPAALTAFTRACPGTSRTGPRRRRPARARRAGPGGSQGVGGRRAAPPVLPSSSAASSAAAHARQQLHHRKPAPPPRARPAHLQHPGHQQRQHGRVRRRLQDHAADAQHDEHAVERQLGQAVGADGPAGAAAAVVGGVDHLGGGPAGAGAAWAGGPSWQARGREQHSAGARGAPAAAAARGRSRRGASRGGCGAP
jgi:hypothetical protein